MEKQLKESIYQNTNSPDYKRIFNDILTMEYPNKRKECKAILAKQELSFVDIIELNQKIFGLKDKKKLGLSQKHRSYTKTSILHILDYQKKNRLNNTQLALHFSLSRNSIAKWRKMFQI